MIDIKKLEQKISLYRLAKTMNITLSTVYSWKYSHIPAWRTAAVIEACRKLGVDISDCMKGSEK